MPLGVVEQQPQTEHVAQHGVSSLRATTLPRLGRSYRWSRWAAISVPLDLLQASLDPALRFHAPQELRRPRPGGRYPGRRSPAAAARPAAGFAATVGSRLGVDTVSGRDWHGFHFLLLPLTLFRNAERQGCFGALGQCLLASWRSGWRSRAFLFSLILYGSGFQGLDLLVQLLLDARA